MQIEQFSDLVLGIYEASTNPAAWPRVLANVANALEAERALLFTPYQVPTDGGFIFPHAITPDQIALWATRYQAADKRAQRYRELDLLHDGNVVLGHEVVSEEELLASEWYREFLSRIDIFHQIAGVVFGSKQSDVPLTLCSFYRGRQSTRFDERSRELLRLLVPHLSCSLGVMYRLRDAEFRVAASLHALDQVNSAILLIDEHARVCFANAMAESLLRKRDGLGVKAVEGSSEGTLVASDPDTQAALDRALQVTTTHELRGIAHFGRSLRVRRPSGLPDFIVNTAPLPESNPYGSGVPAPRAIVFINDLAQKRTLDPALLQRTYGLTAAEARTAMALCEGDSLGDVGAALDVSINTLKTQLQGIYAKTGVGTRSGLTALLLSLAAN